MLGLTPELIGDIEAELGISLSHTSIEVQDKKNTISKATENKNKKSGLPQGASAA